MPYTVKDAYECFNHEEDLDVPASIDVFGVFQLQITPPNYKLDVCVTYLG